MGAELHLSISQLETLCGVLARHLPQDCVVQAFGSRATGEGLKPHSDLDLLLCYPMALPLIVMANLREALTESDLAFSVDLLEASEADTGFLAQARSKGTVNLSFAALYPQEASIHTADTPPESTLCKSMNQSLL